jgi:hypothetical protein
VTYIDDTENIYTAEELIEKYILPTFYMYVSKTGNRVHADINSFASFTCLEGAISQRISLKKLYMQCFQTADGKVVIIDMKTWQAELRVSVIAGPSSWKNIAIDDLPILRKLLPTVSVTPSRTEIKNFEVYVNWVTMRNIIAYARNEYKLTKSLFFIELDQ